MFTSSQLNEYEVLNKTYIYLQSIASTLLQQSKNVIKNIGYFNYNSSILTNIMVYLPAQHSEELLSHFQIYHTV